MEPVPQRRSLSTPNDVEKRRLVFGPAALAVLALAVLSSCTPRAIAAVYVARAASNGSGAFGWFAARGEELVRVGAELDSSACPASAAGAPTYVVVHGLGGDGVETRRTLELLRRARPAGVFLFRWFPWSSRDALVSQLSRGVSTLGWCGTTPVVVLAHSAGGVLASLAAARVVAPPTAPPGWLTVVTVASPLAGTVAPARRDDQQLLMFFLDLGTATHYPAPARGVRVLHLRTSPPADPDMAAFLGHAPNDVGVGVPGARQIDLPRALTHSGAMVYVGRRLADGSFARWANER